MSHMGRVAIVRCSVWEGRVPDFTSVPKVFANM